MGSEENKQLGFIVLFRSLVNWEWFQDRNTLHVYIYCLLRANHKKSTYKGTVIERGSFVTTMGHISADCNLTIDKIRTALKHLKNSENITTKFNGKGLIISINNYDDYQNIPSKSQAVPNHIPSKSQHNNNDNNVNKEVVVENNNYSSDFIDFWKVYKRKGYIDDVYSYWQSMNVTPELKKAIVYGAKKYCESISDKRAMVFPRTFLKNRMWTDYPLPKQEDDMIAWLESKGYVKDEDEFE